MTNKIVYERWWWHPQLETWIRDPSGQHKSLDKLTSGNGKWRVEELNLDTGERIVIFDNEYKGLLGDWAHAKDGE
jgi:hypothetical protein